MKEEPNYDSSGRKLPEGHESWGPMDNIAEKINEERAAEAAASIGKAPLQWKEVPTKNPKKPLWRPVIEIKGIAKKEGAPRPKRMFFEGERQMFLMSYMVDCSAYIFGVDCYLQTEKDGKVSFAPNPEFGKLSCIKTRA
jgi:hypothetical protein